MDIKTPDKDQMLYQVWFAVVGSNGAGLCTKVEQLEICAGNLKKELEHFHDTRLDSCPMVKVRDKVKRRKFDVRTVALAVLFAGLAAAPAWISMIGG